MRETITKDVINKVQEICKTATYDGDKYIIEVGPQAPCSITSIFFAEVIDIALEQLKRKASHSLVEWISVNDDGRKSTTVPEGVQPLTLFQDRKEQFLRMCTKHNQEHRYVYSYAEPNSPREVHVKRQFGCPGCIMEEMRLTA